MRIRRLSKYVRLPHPRISRVDRHALRDDVRLTSFAGGPRVNRVGPFLHHVAALVCIFGLVVDPTRRAPVLMGEAFFDPVAIEAKLIQERRSGAPQVMNRERLKRQLHLTRQLVSAVGDPVEGRIRNRAERVVARREAQVFSATRISSAWFDR